MQFVLDKLRRLDQFAVPVQLNFKGMSSYRTIGGALATVIFYILIVVYLCMKLADVASYADPSISS